MFNWCLEFLFLKLYPIDLVIAASASKYEMPLHLEFLSGKLMITADQKHKLKCLRNSLRYYLNPNLRRKDITYLLNLLTPLTTNIPLIRIGGDNDGGYLVPDDLAGITACFSPGVSDTMTFDNEIMERGIPSFLADASVDGLVCKHELATFDRLFLGAKTTGIYITLDDWIARYAPEAGDLLLQMDIEGAEEETLNAAREETLKRFRIVVLEVHDVHRLTRTAKYRSFRRMIEQLNKYFILAHVHPNNYSPPTKVARWCIPPLLELTYIRRDRVEEAYPTHSFPHPLDEANVQSKVDYPLPRYWDKR